MLTKKQRELYEFLVSFSKEHNGRTPRLKELSSQLNISNNAVLDRLKSLEAQQYIEMPDGVLSIQIRQRLHDVFISYTKADQELANFIFSQLSDQGFRVWQDNKNLRSGKIMTNDIFEAIRDSACFIVLLSKASLRSKWVQEEVQHAKHHQISKSNPKILPIKIKDDFSADENFPEIENIKFYDFPIDGKEENIFELLDSIQMIVYQNQFNEPSIKSSKILPASFIKKSKDRLRSKLAESGYAEKMYPFFEVTLFSSKNYNAKDQRELRELLKQTTIEIDRWGGLNFPPYNPEYEHRFPLDNVNEAVEFYFAGEFGWFHKWELFYFRMDIEGNFYFQGSLREADSTSEKIKDKFAIEWMELDVVRTLLFAKQLASDGKVDEWNAILRYKGLKNRILTILRPNRAPLFFDYISKVDEYESKVIIKSDSNIVELAVKICRDILLIFQWNDLNESVIRSDIQQLVKGVMPD